ncbi:hypothetical protein AURDEDRAFT_118835 [Auricularia subglabra TFB-10046 SS5]|nr:hypothetical protein AURDEDRAFT_118835 [Auricularia subglabra TFB-10046 SS5]
MSAVRLVQPWPAEHVLNSDSLAVVITTAVAASLSGLLVVLLLGRILFVGFQAWMYRDSITLHEPPFLWRPIGVMVTSLLLSNILQVASGVFQIHWAMNGYVHTGHLCTAQGALLLEGDVGVSLFNMIVAVHTFFTVCLHKSWSKLTMAIIILTTWALLTLIPLLGPVFIEEPRLGPFYGISFEWCFINSNYSDERVYLQYIPIFVSTGVILILYLLVFLTVRGTIPPLRVLGVRNTTPSRHLSAAAHRMLWYPAAYIVIMLPLAVARLCSMRGQHVPRWVWHLAVVFIYLTGTVNVLIYASTRKALSPLRWTHRDTRPTTVASDTQERGGSPTALHNIEVVETPKAESLMHTGRRSQIIDLPGSESRSLSPSSRKSG